MRVLMIIAVIGLTGCSHARQPVNETELPKGVLYDELKSACYAQLTTMGSIRLDTGHLGRFGEACNGLKPKVQYDARLH